MSPFTLFIGLILVGAVLLGVGKHVKGKGRGLLIFCAVILCLLGAAGIVVSLL